MRDTETIDYANESISYDNRCTCDSPKEAFETIGMLAIGTQVDEVQKAVILCSTRILCTLLQA